MTLRPPLSPLPEPSPLSAEEFKAAFRNHPAGVALITADPGEGPVALTASSVFSVSADPPLLVFSLSEQSSASRAILRSKSVVVHLLGAQQLHLAKLGAAKDVDRFADASQWRRLATGEPLFLEARTWLRARIVNEMQAGGSVVAVALALETHAPPAGDPSADAASSQPLVFHNRTWHRLDEHSRIE